MTLHEPGLSSSPRRVLVVDDDRDFRLEAAAVLRGAGYEVTEASVADARGFDTVTTSRDTCVVAMTAQSGSVQRAGAAGVGGSAVLIKPITATDLLDAVANCFVQTLA